MCKSSLTKHILANVCIIKVKQSREGGYLEMWKLFTKICVSLFLLMIELLKHSEIIFEYVSPGSTIITDGWRGYYGLDEYYNYRHLTVNHKENFVDPKTGASTQNIEREWREVRKNVQKYGSKLNYAGHFNRAAFIKRFPDQSEREHTFWHAVGNLKHEK